MAHHEDASAAFPFESKYVNVNGLKMHYVEAGSGDPAVLLLHGIPTHAYLWRNVIPHLSPIARTIAIDLVGFGKTDKPTDINYDLPTYAAFLQAAIAALGVKRVVLVAMDLGLIVALHYAMRHESTVAGLAMFEGLFLPVNDALRFQPLPARLMMKLFGLRRFAERALIRSGTQPVDRMMSLGTVRRLGHQELEQYRAPLSDEAVRRKVWLDGVGPHTIRRTSRQPGDLTDLIAQSAEWLRTSPVPKLLLHADPGMAVTAKTVRYAQENIAQLRVQPVGRGKHFLPEDEPDALARAIAGFCRTI